MPTTVPLGECPTGTAGLERIHSPNTSVRGRVTCLTVTPGGVRAVIGVENSLGASPLQAHSSRYSTKRATRSGSSSLTRYRRSAPRLILSQPSRTRRHRRHRRRPARIVGKGAINGIPGGAAAYAYIVGCYAPANTGAPFEVRFGSQRFRLSHTAAVECSDDPTVSSPVGSFDTQVGTGSGTLTSGDQGRLPRDSSTGAAADQRLGTDPDRQLHRHDHLPGRRRATRQVPRLHPDHRLQHRPAAALARRRPAEGYSAGRCRKKTWRSCAGLGRPTCAATTRRRSRFTTRR